MRWAGVTIHWYGIPESGRMVSHSWPEDESLYWNYDEDDLNWK